jgi:hypothetical protein
VPSVFLWWLIPTVTVIVALAVVSWRGRTRPPVEPENGMADFERFREAMDRPMPSRRSLRRVVTPREQVSVGLENLDRSA